MARYRIRRLKRQLCQCNQTIACHEVVDPDGDPIGLYCWSCAMSIRDDLNAELAARTFSQVTPSQEGDEVR